MTPKKQRRPGLLLSLLALSACSSTDIVNLDVIRVLDLEQQEHAPLLPDGRTGTVLVFMATDCPITNASIPALREIVADHAEEPLRFYFVHCQPECDREVARRHAAEFQLPGTVLLDGEQALVGATDATMTPEALVFDCAGDLIYRGRIDDWFADLGTKRQAATTHELRDAIQALLRGERPEVERTNPIGCVIRRR